MSQGCDVVKLEILQQVASGASSRSTGVKRSQHLNFGTRAIGKGFQGVAIELEPRFVDGARAQHRGFNRLDGLDCVLGVVPA